MNHTVEVPAVSPLQSLEMLALRRSVSEAVDKAVAAELSEGTHNIDVTLRLFGTVKKGAPYEQTCPLVIPWQLLFSLAASRLNLQTGASIESIANELMTEADGIMKRRRGDREGVGHGQASCGRGVRSACSADQAAHGWADHDSAECGGTDSRKWRSCHRDGQGRSWHDPDWRRHPCKHGLRH